MLLAPSGLLPLFAEEPLRFNEDIRPILSNNCFHCHGPDEHDRQGGGDGGLRLDTPTGATADLGGYAAIVPGRPDQSALLKRLVTDDVDLLMPPPKSGKKLTPQEIAKLEQWIRQGAPYAGHWSYEAPVRPQVPAVQRAAWCRTPLDHFILARLEREQLEPAQEEQPASLARRLSLDLTGLPPTLEQVAALEADRSPEGYERFVDTLLASPAYGEHWARLWLDLARYADSAGYADDPPRTIWAYRDWVIRSLNANQPFDQFTIEQLAGDLLPNATPEQRLATAFHRNTLTNNEGGTNDEEFRNVAIVDRVNTTMSVWMGTSSTCAQCHNHKYDPITQEEYFRLFAILNNTADADRRDESPLLEIETPEFLQQRRDLEAEIARLERELLTVTPERTAAFTTWEQSLSQPLPWKTLTPTNVTLASGGQAEVQSDGAVFVPQSAQQDRYELRLPLSLTKLSAVRLEALPHDTLPQRGPGHTGNFVLTRVAASVAPESMGAGRQGRFVRIELPGSQRHLMLAEVQVFAGDTNVARSGRASQSSTAYEGSPERALDGNTSGHYFDGKSVTHTDRQDNPWWEVDLQAAAEVERLVLWRRTDGDPRSSLRGAVVSLLDSERQVVWSSSLTDDLAEPSLELHPSGAKQVAFTLAMANHEQPGFPAASVIATGKKPAAGWAIAPEVGKPHTLTLTLREPLGIAGGEVLTLTLEQQSPFEKHTLGYFRVSASDDPRAALLAQLPSEISHLVQIAPAARSEAQQTQLRDYFLREVAADSRTLHNQWTAAKKRLADLKPVTVPVLQELTDKSRRKTFVQRRGNFLDLGPEVQPGVPAVFVNAEREMPVDRLALARFLVSRENPLTARVVVNRYWEQLFGQGLVRTSEEFGSQGELPSHPELLDYLAVEFMDTGWDVKRLLKQIVLSAAYRQASHVTPSSFERDPENRLLARGPRFRLAAETIRDQALAVSGLLSSKMYGPPVRPPRPSSGLSAAFGGGLDWQTSSGEDKYRRALYTEWRRTSPYPSLTTFDATSREACTLKRSRSNTPLQALVTLNDPVYVEAAQALGRRMAAAPGSRREQLTQGVRLCLARVPSNAELDRLEQLYTQAHAAYSERPEAARSWAENPLGPLPAGAAPADYAAWTLVANVLLNLDEFLMKR
jgi:hypothetical protein